jgi:hypothetical protein
MDGAGPPAFTIVGAFIGGVLGLTTAVIVDVAALSDEARPWTARRGGAPVSLVPVADVRNDCSLFGVSGSF